VVKIVKLSGTIPANILPMRADLSVDVPAYRKHLDHLVTTQGVTAVVCNGHAAEVTSLDRTERAQAVAVAAETVAGRVPVIAGVHADNYRDAVEAARSARTEGADALLVFPAPVLCLGGDQEMGYRHVAKIASAVELPIVLFSYPSFTGMAYQDETLARLCELDSVVAVKEWSLDLRKHERTVEIVRGCGHPVALLTSFSTNLLPALVSGADGILSGHGSVIADLQAQLLSHVDSHDLAAARALYDRILLLTKVIYRDPMANMYARMKEHLIMLGHEMSPAVRPPLEQVSNTERAELRAALVTAGLVDGPA
jgi:4-hydroxy-tetrahydrodipicolinate synthase